LPAGALASGKVTPRDLRRSSIPITAFLVSV
jgi:hypothetical protein